MKLFEQFGLNPDWLKKGNGPMYLRTEQGYLPVDAPTPLREDLSRYNNSDSKNAIVTVYSPQGLPEGPDSPGQVVGKLNLPQSFADPGLIVIRIDVTSMEPSIRKGAYVGIDTNQRHVSSGELYGVCLPYEGLVLKRAYIDMQNKNLILRSENPAHPEVFLPLEGHDTHMVGRVAWILQRM